MSLWPISSIIDRMSLPAIAKWDANECRILCTSPSIPSFSKAFFNAWYGLSGWIFAPLTPTNTYLESLPFIDSKILSARASKGIVRFWPVFVSQSSNDTTEIDGFSASRVTLSQVKFIISPFRKPVWYMNSREGRQYGSTSFQIWFSCSLVKWFSMPGLGSRNSFTCSNGFSSIYFSSIAVLNSDLPTRINPFMVFLAQGLFPFATSSMNSWIWDLEILWIFAYPSGKYFSKKATKRLR